MGKRESVSVPCNGCHACCHELVILAPEDDPDKYETMMATNPYTGKPAAALKRKKNGDCHYLGDAGCTIHADAPMLCRVFDCRQLYVRHIFNSNKILHRGQFSPGVLEAGQKRLHTLDLDKI